MTGLERCSQRILSAYMIATWPALDKGVASRPQRGVPCCEEGAVPPRASGDSGSGRPCDPTSSLDAKFLNLPFLTFYHLLHSWGLDHANDRLV